MSAIETTSAKNSHAATALALAPVLSERFALRWPQGALCLFFASVYLIVSYVPLFPAVTWRHVQMGDWILERGLLPNVAPFLPLADGMPWTTTSWLSDVLFSSVHRLAGVQGLSFLLTLLVLATSILIARTAFLQTSRHRWAILTAAVWLVSQASRISVLRPELLSVCCLAVLLWLFSRSLAPHQPATPARPLSRQDLAGASGWLSVAALFVLWANLDGTVVLGVGVMICFALGELLEALAEHRSLMRALDEARVRRTVLLAELAGAATLLQPLGWDLWADVFRGPRSSIWATLGGPSPLVLASATGLAVTLVWLLTAVLLRVSPRRIRVADALLLIGATGLVALHRYATIWLAPVALFVLLPHLAEVVSKLTRRASEGDFSRDVATSSLALRVRVTTPDPLHPPFAFKVTLLAALVIWCAFVLSPIAGPLMGRRPQALERIVSQQTPLGLSNFLKQQPQAPQGLVWVPEEWGDWLAWQGPAGLKISANSQQHLLPERLRQDIAVVVRAEGNWTRTLDRYGVELLVVDKQRQPRLADAAASQEKDWSLAYEDRLAIVLKRRAF